MLLIQGQDWVSVMPPEDTHSGAFFYTGPGFHARKLPPPTLTSTPTPSLVSKLLIRGQWLELFYLLNQVGFLVIKLLILGAVCVEAREKLDQFVLVAEQDLQDGTWLVWVGHKHLEDMEGLKLNVARLLLQHNHHQLQVIWVADVSFHYLMIQEVRVNKHGNRSIIQYK